MFKIILSAILITVFTLADGPILQTGQVKSYDADGTIVAGISIKDDGYYRAGADRNYTRRGDVVIDNATALEWQDNESVDSNWSDAISYCSSLPLDGGDWRLPTIEELETLVDNGHYDPSTTGEIFSHISSSRYWSSTTYGNYTNYAWVVDFHDDGNMYGYTKANSYYVRCVRGGQLDISNLSRNNETEIVIDSVMNLEWQDDEIVKTIKRTWIGAIDYCENTLTLGGHDDWRLPNKKELFSIVDYSTDNPAMDISSSGFQNYTLDRDYWSSTTSAYYTGYACNMDFGYGSSGCMSGKSNEVYVRCVRGGQFGHFPCPEGQHIKQGEEICIPGTPAPDPGEYPPIADRNYLQGNINIEGNRTEDLGWTDPYPPLCPPGQIQIQGAGCTIDFPKKILKDPCELKEGMAALPIDCWEPQHEHEIKGS